MKIIHRISEKATSEILDKLCQFGIAVSPDPLGIVRFEVDESDERWPEIQRWMAERGNIGQVYTEFSPDEIARAQWLELQPTWHYGYPQPKEDDFGYLEATYHLNDYCERCGVGLVQKAPFQMRGEPKWGRRAMLQLNWVFDEYFIKPEVWEKLFKPRGVACGPVLNTKGKRLATVVQLVVPAQGALYTDRLEGYRCELCGRIKYRPFTRGYFPALKDSPVAHMVKSNEYFGGAAFKAVLVSQQLATDLRRENIRGISFMPLAEAARHHE